MNRELRKAQNIADISLLGGGESSQDKISDLKRDLEGWREVLIPLASVLRWDKPHYPAFIGGTTTFFFALVWYSDMSALTAISLACLLLGLFDFIVPFMGATITGLTTWTVEEETQFTHICEKIASVRQDAMDTWQGLTAMRQYNSKLFFCVTIGLLTLTAWIGNMVDNLLLSYLIVNFTLLLPGLRHHQVGHKYLQPVVVLLRKLRMIATEKEKTT